MGYLGDQALGGTLTFYMETALPETSVMQDADSLPTYRIYDTATNTPVWQSTMVPLEAGGGFVKTVRFPSVEGRYLRFVALSEINDGPWASCAEFNIYSDNALVPQSLLSIASFSSQNAGDPEGGEAIHMLDGNPATIWHTFYYTETPPTHPHEVVFDLGAIYPLDGFAYTPRPDAGNGTVRNYECYVTESYGAWGSPVASGVLGAGVTGFYVATVALTTAVGFIAGGRYGVRMQATVGGITGALHHTFHIAGLSATTVTPAKMAFRAPQTIPKLTSGTLVTTPARMAWQAATARMGRLVTVTPSRMAFIGSAHHLPIDPDGRKGRLVRRPRRNTGRFAARPGLQNAIEPGHPLARDLVAWWLARPWMFGGMTWFELQGGNHANLTNMGHTATSGFGGTFRQGGTGEVRFDGINDYVQGGVGAFGTLDLTGSFTLSAWLWLTSYGGGNLGRIIDKRGSGATGWAFVLAGSTTSLNMTINAGATPGADTIASLTGTLSTGRWLHALVTVSEASTVTFYIDGLAVPNQDGFAGFDQTVIANALALQIGGAPNRVDRYFEGNIDDVRIWRRALTKQEVHEVYITSLLGYGGLLAPPHPLWIMVTPAAARPTPARMAMKAATATLIRNVLATPGKIALKAATVSIVRLVIVTSTKMAWSAPSARTGRGFVEPIPARMAFRATGTRTGQFVLCHPAQMGL